MLQVVQLLIFFIRNSTGGNNGGAAPRLVVDDGLGVQPKCCEQCYKPGNQKNDAGDRELHHKADNAENQQCRTDSYTNQRGFRGFRRFLWKILLYNRGLCVFLSRQFCNSAAVCLLALDFFLGRNTRSKGAFQRIILLLLVVRENVRRSALDQHIAIMESQFTIA